VPQRERTALHCNLFSIAEEFVAEGHVEVEFRYFD
jgi:hypothetical protein